MVTHVLSHASCRKRSHWDPQLQLDLYSCNFLFFTSCWNDGLLWTLQAFELELRREYTEHYLCKQVLIFVSPIRSFSKLCLSIQKLHTRNFHFAQIRILKEIDSLKDVTVRFG